MKMLEHSKTFILESETKFIHIICMIQCWHVHPYDERVKSIFMIPLGSA